MILWLFLKEIIATLTSISKSFWLNDVMFEFYFKILKQRSFSGIDEIRLVEQWPSFKLDCVHECSLYYCVDFCMFKNFHNKNSKRKYHCARYIFKDYAVLVDRRKKKKKEKNVGCVTLVLGFRYLQKINIVEFKYIYFKRSWFFSLLLLIINLKIFPSWCFYTYYIYYLLFQFASICK